MSDPRGAVGDAPETLVPASPDVDASPSHEPAPEQVPARAGRPEARPLGETERSADVEPVAEPEAATGPQPPAEPEVPAEPETVAEPETAAQPAPAAGTDDGPPADEHPLDASAHAHLLSEPLPPGAATETAVIYHVTLGEPPAPEEAPAPTEHAHPAAAHRASSTGAPGGPATPAPTRPSPGARRAGAVGAVLLVAALATLAGYLWISATEWRDHARTYERTATNLGDDLASARNQLAGTQAELEAVRAQLATAHERIVELADEKNQALDDWELTQQLVDYQQRVSEAAGNVALALDQCVQGQQELIGFLEQQAFATPTPPPYDPVQLAEFEAQVEKLCQDASEANIALQLELAR